MEIKVFVKVGDRISSVICAQNENNDNMKEKVKRAFENSLRHVDVHQLSFNSYNSNEPLDTNVSLATHLLRGVGNSQHFPIVVDVPTDTITTASATDMTSCCKIKSFEF